MLKMEKSSLEQLFHTLKGMGFQLVGPVVEDDAIVYREIEETVQLPYGWQDHQRAGEYRLTEVSKNKQFFSFNLGPDSLKRFFFPAKQKIFSANSENGSFTIASDETEEPPLAIIGVRACELSALKVQDRVFVEGPYVDQPYKKRRERNLLVAVNCNQSSNNCFCVSMGGGPRNTEGYDICLTEVVDEAAGEYFLVESRGTRGQEIIDALNLAPAEDHLVRQSLERIDQVGKKMTKTMDTQVASKLDQYPRHGQWQEIAKRCLSCANCTLVCPTCFCSKVEDITSLTGDHSERWRSWDSCFNPEFSFIHGGAVRNSTAAQYRQWLTHKLSSWQKQFDVSGCVGCGRCVTWCPVGIDLTEEVDRFKEVEHD